MSRRQKRALGSYLHIAYLYDKVAPLPNQDFQLKKLLRNVLRAWFNLPSWALNTLGIFEDVKPLELSKRDGDRPRRATCTACSTILGPELRVNFLKWAETSQFSLLFNSTGLHGMTERIDCWCANIVFLLHLSKHLCIGVINVKISETRQKLEVCTSSSLSKYSGVYDRCTSS